MNSSKLPTPSISATNGDTSLTNGTSYIPAQDPGQTGTQGLVLSQNNAPLQPQGISAGNDNIYPRYCQSHEWLMPSLQMRLHSTIDRYVSGVSKLRKGTITPKYALWHH